MPGLIEGLLSKLNQVRDTYSYNNNIIKIGIGLKEVAGLTSKEVAFRFYVDKKLPISNINSKELIPPILFGASTDVIQIGKIQGLASVSDSPAVNQERYRRRGIRGGVCIRNEHFSNRHSSGFGTLGILARRVSDNKLVGLTCSHVANNGSDTPTTINTKIGQPRYWTSCCCCPAGYMGLLIAATLDNDLDCALIELDEDVERHVISNTSENKIVDFENDIVGAALPVLGSFVKKYGQATGLTEGRIVDIAYGPDQMFIELEGGNPGDSFAHHGDSGAVIVNETDQVVGLLVAAWQEETLTDKLPFTKGIATFIKPIMEELDISIAGVTADLVVTPIASSPWIGGQADPLLNPIEVITSNDMGFSGNVDWDISTGIAGAVIIETTSQIAIGRSEISIRYNSVSASSRNDDAVIIKATKDEVEEIRYRTVIKITPELNLDGIKHDKNDLFFMLGGGFSNQAGAFTTDTVIGAATRYLAKAEIIYHILPVDVQWYSQLDLDFVFGSSIGMVGQIISRRESKYAKGRQSLTDPHRIHTEQNTWTLEPDGNVENVQFPSNDEPAFLFRMANYGFDPAELQQAYDRADYRDFLAFYNGNEWVPITPYAEWHTNLTANLKPSGGTPEVGAVNNIGLGPNSELIPNDPPTVTLPNMEIVAEAGEAIDLEAIVLDPNNDNIEVEWEQISGASLGWTDSKIKGNPINIPSTALGGSFEFRVVGDDGTGGLYRTANNHLSIADARVTVRVIEWLNRVGGNVRLCVNNVEEFNAADFGIGGGALDWDLTTGGTSAVIIEKDGASIAPVGIVNNASSIKVSYNNLSSNNSKANSVKILARNTGDGRTWFKRRTVNNVAFNVVPSINLVPPSPASIIAIGTDYGYTEDENITATICAYRSGANWKAAVLTVTGNYSVQTTRAGTLEVTGPGGNTNLANYCPQMNDLAGLGYVLGTTWYMLSAIQAHEAVHVTRLLPALNHVTVLPVLIAAIEALVVPHAIGMTQVNAIAQIRALVGYGAALNTGRTNWDAEYINLLAPDHLPGGPTDAAELAIVNPMIAAICAHSRANGWAPCPPHCP